MTLFFFSSTIAENCELACKWTLNNLIFICHFELYRSLRYNQIQMNTLQHTQTEVKKYPLMKRIELVPYNLIDDLLVELNSDRIALIVNSTLKLKMLFAACSMFHRGYTCVFDIIIYNKINHYLLFLNWTV